uniref:Hva1_TUDOR domain-containing protein n=1 Tax=Globodera pallida TaxID=36090 RepID=A0A183CM41_GLOPA
MSNQSAAELADEYERGEHGEVIKSNQGKRTKTEQVEHKHPHPEGDTRRIVDNAVNGEEKRKEKERERTTSQSSK